MKQLKCDMCGSTDLIKKDGIYICQYCGSQHKIEETPNAKIEVVLQNQNTNIIDNKSLLENARRALEKTDWEDVIKYYNTIEEKDPHNIEAIFFSAYGKAMLSLYDSDSFKREQKFEVLKKSISFVKDYYDISKSKELRPILEIMSNQIIAMSLADFVFNYKIDQDGFTTNDKEFTLILFVNIETQFINTLLKIVEKDENESTYHLLVKHLIRCLRKTYIRDKQKLLYKKYLINIFEKIKKLNPNYIPPEQFKPTKTNLSPTNNDSDSLSLLTILGPIVLIIIALLIVFIALINDPQPEPEQETQINNYSSESIIPRENKNPTCDAYEILKPMKTERTAILRPLLENSKYLLNANYSLWYRNTINRSNGHCYTEEIIKNLFWADTNVFLVHPVSYQTYYNGTIAMVKHESFHSLDSLINNSTFYKGNHKLSPNEIEQLLEKSLPDDNNNYY